MRRSVHKPKSALRVVQILVIALAVSLIPVATLHVKADDHPPEPEAVFTEPEGAGSRAGPRTRKVRKLRTLRMMVRRPRAKPRDSS